LNRCKSLGLNDDDSNEASREGTAAHWVREECLDVGLDPFDFIGTRINIEGQIFECDTDMADYLLPGIDRIRQFAGPIFVELRVNITPWVGLDEDGNEQFGTLDAGVVGDDLIVISDLKYGRGIPVEVFKNYQQVIYALGFYEQVAKYLTKATKFLIIIDQPRNAEGGGEWETDIDELRAIGEWIKERAALTFDKNAPCEPSKEACTWCPASKKIGACPEHETWQLAQFELDVMDLDDVEDFDAELTMPDVTTLTDSRVKVLYQHRAMMRKFIDRVEAEVIGAAKAGEGDRFGMKLVSGKRSKRKHKDEFDSEMWLFDAGFSDEQIINKQLKTVAQLDKVCGRGKFPQELIIGGEPQPVVVPIEDARPALQAANFIDEEVDDLDDFE
jgi:hypothetical protein